MPSDEPEQQEIPAGAMRLGKCTACGVQLGVGEAQSVRIGKLRWLCLECWRAPRHYWQQRDKEG